MRKSMFAFLLMALCLALAAQQPMNDDTVIRMLKAGLPIATDSSA